MIVLKHQLNNKEKQTITGIILTTNDVYGDFYLTKKLLRLSIKENIRSLFESLKKGDYIAYDLETETIAVITGFAEKRIKIFDIHTKEEKEIESRKYVKILSSNEKGINRILTFIDLHFRHMDLYCKIKKNNPIRNVLYRNYFKFSGGRGDETLYVKKGRKIIETTFVDKGD